MKTIVIKSAPRARWALFMGTLSLILSFAAMTSWAKVLYEEDFNGGFYPYPLDTDLRTVSSPAHLMWSAGAAGTTGPMSIEVTEYTDSPQNNILKLYAGPDGEGSASQYYSFPTYTAFLMEEGARTKVSEALSIRFAFQLQPTPGTPWGGYADFEVRIKGETDATSSGALSAGVYTIRSTITINGATLQDVVNGGDFHLSEETWYIFDLTLPAPGSVEMLQTVNLLSADGVTLLATATGALDDPTITSYSRADFRLRNGLAPGPHTERTVYLDDMLIQSIPEPGTVTLLFIGFAFSAFLLRGRRKQPLG